MLAVTLLWAALAGPDLEGTCVWSHACLCSSVRMRMFLVGGLIVGVPWGAIFGALAGKLVGRFPRRRRLVLTVMTFASASALEAIARPFLRCSTDPDALALWTSALVAIGLGAIALERSLEVPS